jgi:hypothetical protein
VLRRQMRGRSSKAKELDESTLFRYNRVEFS